MSDAFVSDSKINWFFVSPSWQHALQHLTYIDETENAFVVLLGECGIGKSSLLGEFIQNAPAGSNICQIRANSSLTVAGLLTSMAAGFGVSVLNADDAPFEQEVQSQLYALKNLNESCLLIVDDADRLPRQTLAALHYLATQSIPGVRLSVILAGAPKLKTRFEDQELAEDYHVLSLEPLDFSETKHYLSQHKTVDQARLFSQTELKQIYRLSGGMPGRINYVARQVLLDRQRSWDIMMKSNNETSQATRFKNHSVKLVSLFLLALIALGMWFFRDGGLQQFASTIMPSKVRIVEAEAEPSLKAATPNLNQATRLAEKGELDNKVQVPKAAEIAAAPGPTAKAMPAAPAVIVKPKVPKVAIAKASPKPVALWATDVTMTTPKPKPKFVPKPPFPNEHGYVVQLIGVRDRAALRPFLKNPLLKGQTQVVENHYQGKPWFVLLYGDFATQAQAKAAIAKMPKALQKTKPWVRSIEALHKLS